MKSSDTNTQPQANVVDRQIPSSQTANNGGGRFGGRHSSSGGRGRFFARLNGPSGYRGDGRGDYSGRDCPSVYRGDSHGRFPANQFQVYQYYEQVAAPLHISGLRNFDSNLTNSYPNYSNLDLNNQNPTLDYTNHNRTYQNPSPSYSNHNPNPRYYPYDFSHHPTDQFHYNPPPCVTTQQHSNYPAAQQCIPGSSFNMNHQFHPTTQQNHQAIAATYSPPFAATRYANSGGSHHVTNERLDQVTAAIEGVSINSVNSASENKQAIVDKTVSSRKFYTHFISLPLAIHLELVDKVSNFQNSILGNGSCINENTDTDSNGDEGTSDTKEVNQLSKADADVAVELEVDDKSELEVNPLYDLGIDKSIFIKPETIHLTVLMLELRNNEQIKTASEVLRSISSKVMGALDNRPLSIRLKGLECMKGSLAKARVLYAPVEEIGSEGRLLRACQVIIDAYLEAGLVLENDANHRLKLHATVMKSRHGKRNKWTRKVDSFDARGIFKQYGSQDWGEYPIREAHLSQRFCFDENGYYHCCASIPFPENV